MTSLPSDDHLLVSYERRVLEGDFREFYKAKRNNWLATVQAFQGLWRCFLLLDEMWQRGFEDCERITDVRQMLPLILFMNAHAQFRIALELGFSCCIGEAWNVLRSGIESIAHAHKLCREPQLIEVWACKGDGPSQAKAFSKAFEKDKQQSLFPVRYGLDKLHTYWTEFSELGTHTTVGSLAKRFVSREREEDVEWKLEYFETDAERQAIFLFSQLEAGALMEKAFYDCFEARLKLDPTLSKMREEFRRKKEIQRTSLARRFKLPR